MSKFTVIRSARDKYNTVNTIYMEPYTVTEKLLYVIFRFLYINYYLRVSTASRSYILSLSDSKESKIKLPGLM